MNGQDVFFGAMFLVLFGLCTWFALGYYADWRRKRRAAKTPGETATTAHNHAETMRRYRDWR